MLEHFLTVGQQVLILFLLVAVGYVLGRAGVMNEKGGKVCSDLALLLATPCVIIQSFQRPYSTQLLWEVLLALVVAIGLHVVAIVIAQLLYRRRDDTSAVYRTAIVLSNAGFMGLPLQQAVLGDGGVLFGAAYVVVMNLALWSYGTLMLDKSGTRIPVRKMLISPGMIGLVIGLLLFVCRIALPEVILAPIQHIGNLNTPLPMLFTGYYLSRVDIKAALRRVENYGVLATRLIVVPAVGVALMYLCNVRGAFLVSMAIAVSAPTAVSTAMFADRYKSDAESAVNLVAISTVFSLITMPLLVSLVQLLP